MCGSLFGVRGCVCALRIVLDEILRRLSTLIIIIIIIIDLRVYTVHVLYCIQLVWDLIWLKALKWHCAVDGAISLQVQYNYIIKGLSYFENFTIDNRPDRLCLCVQIWTFYVLITFESP